MVHTQAILFEASPLPYFPPSWPYSATSGSIVTRRMKREGQPPNAARTDSENLAELSDSTSTLVEFFPLVLRVTLLLLGFALSRYLWEISITIASVVLGVSSFGLLSYLFIHVTRTARETHPYQTPGSCFFRSWGPKYQ